MDGVLLPGLLYGKYAYLRDGGEEVWLVGRIRCGGCKVTKRREDPNPIDGARGWQAKRIGKRSTHDSRLFRQLGLRQDEISCAGVGPGRR
jgi:hypothetical protein